MFCIRQIKDDYRIMSQATNKDVGFSSQQTFPITLVFDAAQISLH